MANGARIVNTIGFETCASGFTTSTVAVPALATSDASTFASRCVEIEVAGGKSDAVPPHL